jgi:hypothetical protein
VAKYPYTYQVDPAEGYATRKPWLAGDQPVPYGLSEQLRGVAKFGFGVGVASLIGQHRFQSGKLGWDYYINAIRSLEEYSPGHIFRTFQFSHMMSPLESASQVYRYIQPTDILRIYGTPQGKTWLEDLSRKIGRDVLSPDILQQGFRFENGQLRLGTTGGDVLMGRASVIRVPTAASPKLQEALARSIVGGPVEGTTKAFTARIPYLSASGEMLGEAFSFTGGKNWLQAKGRFLGGYGTMLAERINMLARAPFDEMPVISDILKKVPIINRLRFDVVPSSGLKTLGKITGKLGFRALAAFTLYQELDYQVRKSKFFEGTIFNEGVTAGIGTVITRGQLSASKTAEKLGLHDYREKQEEIAPGSTSFARLAAFPILGALGGLGVLYGERVLKQAGLEKAGLSLEQASRAVLAPDYFFKEAIFKTPVPEEVLGALDERSIALVRAETEKKLTGWSGKIARYIATKQEGQGVGGILARGFGKVTPSRLKWMGAGAIGAALILPFIPGSLIPSKRPQELEDLYSGRKKVPIRRGRWWEFGRSDWRGENIERYQMHWYPRMLLRPTEKGIWGEDAPGPVKRWFIENFTYQLERKHYQDRPYPISGTGLEDIPFLGPVLGATVGKIIKPPVYMHTEDWLRGNKDNTEYKPTPPRFGETTAPGELNKGQPISPYDIKSVIGEQGYRMTEMIGLPGFGMVSLKEVITGTPELFDQEMQLESARRMYGPERAYWDKDIGGGLGSTELFRRLYPHKRNQIELYNPIRNTMPDWLPGPEDRSPDFQHGDPYTKVKLGEERLPGPGYEAIYPELKEVEPKDYPLMHRFTILADVAPFSDKFDVVMRQVQIAHMGKKLTDMEEVQYQEIINQLNARKQRKTFFEYKYRDRKLTPVEEILAKANEESKEDQGPSWFAKTVGTYWENLAHNAETPFEYLTPVSPASKFIHMRSAIEDYQRTQLYGTQSAFWEHPIRDFMKPFFSAASHTMGSERVPEDIQQRRDTEEYFDILKYAKYTGLKQKALESGNYEVAREYEQSRRETLFGINPFTHNYTQVFRSMPRRERDYFNSFVKADMDERAEIFKMVPENEQALYLARWKLKDAEDLKKATKKGLLSEEQLVKANVAMESLYEEVRTEGLPKNQELWAEYIGSRSSGESYPDWYRRTKLMVRRLAGRPLPGPDWVGWNPQIDLEDIKLKIVQNEGKSMYDYDLWPDRLRAIARRPVITETAEALKEPTPSPDELRSRINTVLTGHKIRPSSVIVEPSARSGVDMRIEMKEDRSKVSRKMIKDRLLDG